MATALNTTMTSLYGGGSPSKNIFVYRNGDTNFQCKRIVVNPRQIKNWDSFIELITNRVKAKNGGAVRRVFTPTGRTKVHDLSEIENNHFYVAAGAEGFQRHEYNKISGLPAQKTRLKLPPIVKPVQHSKLKVSARCRRAANAMGSKVVFVFRNADDQSPAVKILFNRFMLKNYEVVLDEITRKVNLIRGAVYKLYTLEGKQLSGPEELEDREFYVACGKEEFKKVPYRKDGVIISPRTTRPPQFNYMRRKVTRQAKAQKESKPSKPAQKQKEQQQEKDSKTKKPTPPKPNRKTKQEKTQEQKEAEEVFHSKPTMVRRSREKERGDSLDFSDDPEGVFKAKEERDETKNAEEVQETNDTTIDLPIDQVVAEEIDDEEIKEEAPATEPDNIEERLQQDEQQEPQAFLTDQLGETTEQNDEPAGFYSKRSPVTSKQSPIIGANSPAMTSGLVQSPNQNNSNSAVSRKSPSQNRDDGIRRSPSPDVNKDEVVEEVEDDIPEIHDDEAAATFSPHPPAAERSATRSPVASLRRTQTPKDSRRSSLVSRNVPSRGKESPVRERTPPKASSAPPSPATSNRRTQTPKERSETPKEISSPKPERDDSPKPDERASPSQQGDGQVDDYALSVQPSVKGGSAPPSPAQSIGGDESAVVNKSPSPASPTEEKVQSLDDNNSPNDISRDDREESRGGQGEERRGSPKQETDDGANNNVVNDDEVHDSAIQAVEEAQEQDTSFPQKVIDDGPIPGPGEIAA